MKATFQHLSLSFPPSNVFSAALGAGEAPLSIWELSPLSNSLFSNEIC